MRKGVSGAAGLAATGVSISSRSETVTSKGSKTARVPAAFGLDEATIAELQTGMTSGKHSAQSLVQKYIERMEDVDKHGPAVNSVIELNPDVLSIGLKRDRPL